MKAKINSKVLIVDDLEVNRLALEMILAELNVEIIHANSGERALSQVLNHEFAVILMDVEMPGMNGYQTVQLIHNNKRFKSIPIVMITASDRDNILLNKAYEAGAVDYVTKPIEPVVIVNKVRQFVELDRLHRFAQQATVEAEKTKYQLQTLLNSAGEGVIGLDNNGFVTFANPKACQILEVEHKVLLRANLLDFQIEASSGSEENLTKVDLGNKDLQIENKIENIFSEEVNIKPTGERWKSWNDNVFYVEQTSEVAVDKNGNKIGTVVMFQNITERKENEHKLHYLANYDCLTDLANRAYFNDILTKMVARTKRTGVRIAILFIDLDHFKFVNDQYGHDTGDTLLQFVSSMLRQSVREGDLVARIGGDEFAIILYDIKSSNGMANVAQKILEKIAEPVYINGIELNISVSIGIAAFEEHLLSTDELLKAADTAMYSAKLAGRNNYQFFSTTMQETVLEKQQIQIMLQHAIVNNELSLMYQPQVSVSNKSMVGCEALLRWNPQNGKTVGPDKFIPIAEESGQIEQLGEWVIKEVCKQLAFWNKELGNKEFCISVNVSVCQLRNDKFKETLKCLLKKYELLPQQIEVEITETAMTNNYQHLFDELTEMHEFGINTSLDDFGTGHASLDNLRKLPLDKMKIDKSFIEDIGTDECDEDIIKIIIAVAQKLSLVTVAEGVETVEQLRFLSNENCDFIQGYFFSKPVSAEKMLHNLKNSKNLFDKQFIELISVGTLV